MISAQPQLPLPLEEGRDDGLNTCTKGNASPVTTPRRVFLRGAVTALVAAAAAGTTPSAVAAPGFATTTGRMSSPPSFYKQRASDDYRASMRPFGGQLASPPAELFRASQEESPWQFDVVIIGSGYEWH